MTPLKINILNFQALTLSCSTTNWPLWQCHSIQAIFRIFMQTKHQLQRDLKNLKVWGSNIFMRLQRTLIKLHMFTKFSLIHRAVGLSFCLNEKEKLWKGWHRQKAGSFDLGCYDFHDVTRIAARRFSWQLERIDDLWFLECSYKGCTFYTVEKYKEPRTRNTKNWGVIFGGEGRCLEVTSLPCLQDCNKIRDY